MEKDNFYPTLIKIAIPIFLQNVMAVFLGFIDVIMVTRISEDALSSVSIANQIFVVLYTFLAGLASGASIYFARYWGSKQYYKMPVIITISGFIMLVIGLFIAIICIVFDTALISAISKGQSEIIRMGSSYLKITAYSFPFVAMSTILVSYFRSVERSKYPMFISFLVIIINTCLNYVLIFGKFGFPELGVDGAAIATVVARVFEFVIILFIYISPKNPVRSNIDDYRNVFYSPRTIAEVKPFLLMAMPLCICDMVWALGQIGYKFLFSQMGGAVLAGTSAVDSFFGFFYISFVAYGIASAAMIGKVIGEGDLVKARDYAYRFIKLNFIIATPLGVILFFIAPYVTDFYNLKGESAKVFIQSCQIVGVIMNIRSLEFLIIVGILRAGGRTSFIPILQFLGVWIVSLIPSFIAYFVFNASFFVVYCIINADMLFKAAVGYYRLHSNRWLKSDLTKPT